MKTKFTLENNILFSAKKVSNEIRNKRKLSTELTNIFLLKLAVPVEWINDMFGNSKK